MYLKTPPEKECLAILYSKIKLWREPSAMELCDHIVKAILPQFICMFQAAAVLWKKIREGVGYQRHLVNLQPLSVLLPHVPTPRIYFAPSHNYWPDLSSFTPTSSDHAPPWLP